MQGRGTVYFQVKPQKIRIYNFFPEEGRDAIFKSMNSIAFLYINIFFPLKWEAFLILLMLTISFSQPLISGEAPASLATPVPRPLSGCSFFF